MTNQRDSGRYDAVTDTWIDDNVRVDFAWGNIPMQPDDDRGMAQLDPDLDSHIIATSGYEGFPAFITGAPYDDTVANATAPNLVGLATSAINAALSAAGFTEGYQVVNTSTAGATALNNGKVKSQDPVAGEVVNSDRKMNVVTYNYVAPATTGPISGINRTAQAELGGTLNGNQVVMYVVGRTVKPTVGDTITLSGTGVTAFNVPWVVSAVGNNDSYNTGGTSVKLTLVSGTFGGSTTATGGTWTKV
ncbi:PASTA_pknB domain containing protein [uncultured Caudovirales phage]|uniref:PASTA_pknB domain containing protein n=1 Tax=uncultured Caudovirales phage TaxID=2100421 RepID=A0A6J5L7A0_9CAUD|nr:PASTA_pknB domain containing protein [uncultured Caudovirales phage]